MSLDAADGVARIQQLFDATKMPCTTTLYNWINSGVMTTGNLDLLEKRSRNTKKKKNNARRNHCILGQSIDDCLKKLIPSSEVKLPLILSY